MFFQGFVEAGVRNDPVAVVQVQPPDVAVGSGAQLEDRDNAAQVVEVLFGGVIVFRHTASLAAGHSSCQRAAVSSFLERSFWPILSIGAVLGLSPSSEGGDGHHGAFLG